jgi:hypothetical protein
MYCRQSTLSLSASHSCTWLCVACENASQVAQLPFMWMGLIDCFCNGLCGPIISVVQDCCCRLHADVHTIISIRAAVACGLLKRILAHYRCGRCLATEWCGGVYGTWIYATRLNCVRGQSVRSLILCCYYVCAFYTYEKSADRYGVPGVSRLIEPFVRLSI